MDQKLAVRFDGMPDRMMTKAQAKRYGDRHMPSNLKACGFKTVIFTADPEINGWLGYRINYGK